MKKIILSLMLLLMLPVNVLGKDSKKDSGGNKPVLIMASEPGGKATDQFDCREKVYVDFTFDAEEGSNHIVEFFWIGPNGKQQTYAEYKVLGNRVWPWIEIYRPSFGDRLLEIDSSDYIGEWKVRVRINGELVSQKNFYVAC
ncbi:MAG: hypothetical protein AAB456_01740 [Patescibacteria group bacterium]